ncbi:MAG: nucleotidyltransferase family protein [Pseudomonadota bacterium]|nr:nucleotidyltransferase family protein [Pseudomonadota bacterium]
MKTIGILLAAGKSQRFGPEDKLLSTYQGQLLCRYAAEAMRASDADGLVVCISSPSLEPEFDGFQVTRCGGLQSDSLKAGIKAAIALNADRILVALADMPHITTGTLNTLLETKASLAACAKNGNRPTVPALFDHTYFDTLLKLEGDQGARKLLQQVAPENMVPISPSEAFDVDTQADLSGPQA